MALPRIPKANCEILIWRKNSEDSTWHTIINARAQAVCIKKHWCSFQSSRDIDSLQAVDGKSGASLIYKAWASALITAWHSEAQAFPRMASAKKNLLFHVHVSGCKKKKERKTQAFLPISPTVSFNIFRRILYPEGTLKIIESSSTPLFTGSNCTQRFSNF